MASAVIGALRVNLGIDTAAFSDGLKSAQGRLAGFGASLKTGLVAAGAAATAALGGMAFAMKGSIDAADEMSKAASKIGIPTEELSRLKYAADLSGVSFEGLQTGVRKVSSLMADSAAGITAAQEAMARYGLSAKNADGSLKSASQIMSEVADKFAAMPDGAEKTAMALDLFGKAGADMIPLLNGGSAALGNLMAEADKFGQVFTDGMGKNAEAFNDNLSRLQGAFGTLAADLATRLLPYLVKFTDWLVVNTPNIAAAVQAVIDFAVNLGRIGSAAVQAVSDLVSAFVGIHERMQQIGRDIIDGLWNGISTAYEGVKGKITGIASGIKDSFTGFFNIRSPSRVMAEQVGAPIIQGIAAGMEAEAGTVNSVAKSIGDSIGSSFAGIIDGSKTAQDAIKDLIKAIAQLAIQDMTKSFGGGVGGFMGSIFSGLMGFANGGSFQVGGSGGIDSQLVAFKASPNERVSITKPGQDSGMGGNVGVDVRVAIDDQGALQAYVARSTAASENRMASSVPKIVDGRLAHSRARGTRA